MIFFQQFCARPWAVALSHCCSCRIGMAPTQYLNVKCGGFTVSRQHFCNISNVVCIPHNHSQLNSTTYSFKYFTPLYSQQKLSCLRHCFRLCSTDIVPYNRESDDSRRGGASFTALFNHLQMLNINCGTYKPGQHSKTLCPECQGGSTKERSLSLFIGVDGTSATWNCFRAKCGWNGGTKKIPMSAGSSTRELQTLALENTTSNGEVMYTVPNVEFADAIPNVEFADAIPNEEVVDIKDFTVKKLKLEEISAEISDYFASRQISRKTLQRNGVMQTRRNYQTIIVFTYRRNDNIVNCKYRDVQKRFWQEKHGEKIPYGLDDIKEAREIIIVEGEIDKLSMEEVGYRNCISVPDGAPSKVSTKELPPVEQDKKYEYLWSSKEYFEQATRIILATDGDKPGQALAEELARRLGRERCWRVTWPRRSETEDELCKDANEVLVRLGQEALKKVIKGAELYPIQGLFRFSRFFAEIDAYYNRQLGTELGVSTGWVGLGELYRVVPGELTLVTGVPNSGKSEWIDALLCNLSHGEGWSFVLCSMGNKVQEHARKLLEKHIKKPFFDAKIYPMKRFTPLFRKQKLSCFRVSSTMPMVDNSGRDDCRSGDSVNPLVIFHLLQLEIVCDPFRAGEFNRLLCPQCGGGRTRKKSFIVFIYPDGNCAMWRCFNVECNWSGITMGTPMSTEPPTPKLDTLVSKNATSNIENRDIRYFTKEDLKLEQISEQICEYFANRQISIDTLQRNGVMKTRRNYQDVIAFTYRRNGKIVNCKYRDLQKRYWQEKNGETVPYGLDDIKEARVIIIVEGEIDKLSMEEAGYKNCISVPNGAPPKVSTKDLPLVEKDKKYLYVWNFKEYFDQASRIILATDADEPGQALAEELARRLGRERCWRVTWPRKSETANEFCKDANEVLICLGRQALKEVIESAELYILQELF